MKAAIVSASHPAWSIVHRLVQFEMGGRKYFVTPYQIGTRHAFGPADGIRVVETHQEITIPEERARNYAALVEFERDWREHGLPFLEESSEWFYDPTHLAEVRTRQGESYRSFGGGA